MAFDAVEILRCGQARRHTGRVLHPTHRKKRDGWGAPRHLGWLEVFFVADGHAGRGFDGFGGDEFCGVALEFVDAVDERGAVDGFGCVSGWRGGGEFFEDVVDVGAGDGAGLAGGCGIDGESEHGFECAEFDGAFDLGGHGVAAFGALGDCLGDGFEDAAQ